MSVMSEIYTLSIKSDKTTCIIGESITFTGKFMYYWNGHSEPVVGAEIGLYYYFPSNPWNVMEIGSGVTDSDGNYQIVWITDKIGDLACFTRSSGVPSDTLLISVLPKPPPPSPIPWKRLILCLLAILSAGGATYWYYKKSKKVSK